MSEIPRLRSEQASQFRYGWQGWRLPRFARNDTQEASTDTLLPPLRGTFPPVIARYFPPVIARHDSAEAISGTMVVVSKHYYIYIMTNNRNTVLYVGVTSDLIRRVYEHKAKLADGFTKKYNIVKLVYYEVFEDIENAILREKQIKAGSRQKKVQLINSTNKEWHDLYDEL